MEETVPGDGWISDDSSFYGDETEQERLEVLCEEFQSGKVWPMRKNDLNAVVFEYRNVPPPTLINPGERHPGCWQLGEAVEDFVRRLPPVRSNSNIIHVHDFTVRGQELLAQSLKIRKDIETNSQKSKSSVTRRLNEESSLLQRRITDLATETGVLSGKWMLFLPTDDLTRVWRLIVDGVINNRLGPTAKVAPDEGEQSERLICVYTKDFRDKDDILRVLRELVSIGVVGAGNKPIHYKSDPYTYLNIYRETAAEYGLQASLYSSHKLLAEEKLQQAVLTPRAQSSLNRFDSPTSR